MSRPPNIVVIMTDQQRADVSAREGFPLDTTPFLDSLACQGSWFDRAYTAVPICSPARASFLTGRFPSAHRVRSNYNSPDVFYDKDLFDVAKEKGHATALIGKNHSYLSARHVDYFSSYWHTGGSARTDEERAFDDWLDSLNHRVTTEPTPFPLECQLPHRIVSEAQTWIRSLRNRPFTLWLSFPEPHNPYQVPEPYFSMFPPETLPPNHTGREALAAKGFKWRWYERLCERAFPGYEAFIPRARANYFGLLRLLDDQIARFVGFLQQEGLWEDTLLVFVSDHGDFVGEYGLTRKGLELPEVLTRVPLFFVGTGVHASATPHPAHVSLVDVMPTLCEAMGMPLPSGVQGRSLWPLLTGQDYPEGEFSSVYAEQGFGGLDYDEGDDPSEVVHCWDFDSERPSFDELNSFTQSGTMRMVRKGKWKLVFDMMGRAQLFDLKRDPFELVNLYNRPEQADAQREMLAELLTWTLRMQDPLPLPRANWVMKRHPRNYWRQEAADKGDLTDESGDVQAASRIHE